MSEKLPKPQREMEEVKDEPTTVPHPPIRMPTREELKQDRLNKKTILAGEALQAIHIRDILKKQLDEGDYLEIIFMGKGISGESSFVTFGLNGHHVRYKIGETYKIPMAIVNGPLKDSILQSFKQKLNAETGKIDRVPHIEETCPYRVVGYGKKKGA